MTDPNNTRTGNTPAAAASTNRLFSPIRRGDGVNPGTQSTAAAAVATRTATEFLSPKVSLR